MFYLSILFDYFKTAMCTQGHHLVRIPCWLIPLYFIWCYLSSRTLVAQHIENTPGLTSACTRNA